MNKREIVDVFTKVGTIFIDTEGDYCKIIKVLELSGRDKYDKVDQEIITVRFLYSEGELDGGFSDAYRDTYSLRFIIKNYKDDNIEIVSIPAITNWKKRMEGLI